MKLREAIKHILDEDWLEIKELLEGKHKYRKLIGRAPKSLVKGEVLDYEVLSIGSIQNRKDYTIHVFLVKDTLNS